jgi:hypothetical protein
MASLSSKVKTYLANNGVNEVDFMVDVLLQDDSNGKGPYIKSWNVSGVVQDPSAFTITGSQITFSSNPASSDTFFGTVLGDTFDIGTPTDSTVTAASLGSTFFVKNSQTFTSISMAGTTNGAVVGPVTVSGTVTIPAGSTFVIL